MTTQASDARIGTEVGGYRIDSVVGSGGMGVVYRARHLHLEREVALKLLSPALADNEGFRKRFVHESRMAASLRHPNIVVVYDAGEDDGVLFIAMQLVEGMDLATLLHTDGRLRPERTVAILGQVAEALDAAHTRGLVHRDVKPANVMLDAETAYLTDFGLTKQTTALTDASTEGHVLGTIDYVAPEQVVGEKVDGCTDVYALGCVLHHCLTGCVPFPRESEMATLFAHVHDAPPRISDMRPDLPAGLDRVLGRAMAKHRDERYPTCNELLADIRGELVAGRSAAASARTSRLRLRPHRPRRRSALAALLVLGAAGATAAVLLSGGEDDGAKAPRSAPAKAAPSSAGAPAATVGRPVAVGKRPFSVVVGGGSVWVAAYDDDAVQRLDPRSGRGLGEPIPAGNGPFSLAITAGRVWVANARTDSVRRIDTRTSEGVGGAPISVGDGPMGVAAGDGAVWTANHNDNTVTRIDAATGRVTGEPIGVGDKPRGIVTTRGKVWVANRRDATVTRIDTSAHRVQGRPIRVGRDPQGMAAVRNTVWVVNNDDDTVTRISARTGRVLGRPVRVGRSPFGLAYGEGFVWVTNSASNTVTRHDPRTGRRVGRPIRVAGQPEGIAVGRGYVWVTSNDAGTVTRIKPEASP